MKPLPTSPAAVFLAFIAALFAALLFAAVASPWVQAALSPVAQVPLHRVFSRLTMVGVLALTIWLMVRHRLADRGVLGFKGPASAFLARAGIALVIGIAMMTAAFVPLFQLRVLEWNASRPDAWSGWLVLAGKGLASGVAVALIEETFFRGAMQGALQRMGARRAALFGVPLLYAAVHFLGRPSGVGAPEVENGFAALAQFFTRLAHPLQIADAFVALWFVGLLLALVRRRFGDIAGCMGLHAGFVTTIAVFRRTSSPVGAGDWSFLVGPFDGLLGWWIALLAGAACLALAAVLRTRRP
jgi:membrane protease YdiL (CAAX protease family)